MEFPSDYLERVYAGVLGKIIGVYLGRPCENWSYERIRTEFGEIDRYVHGQHQLPLIVTDDDISGTFTFVRAFSDHQVGYEITPTQIGESWLNYLIERRTILWWGGFGNSTEHTAYLRLKGGIPAPRSGSMQLNGRVIAEQIGAQIFIDSWAMLAPGDPQLAANLARRAASVSHDGEAIYAAQVIASMEAAAFIENHIDRLLDIATQQIPHDSIIYRLIDDIRDWHVSDEDWRNTREKIVMHYGYDRYPGVCHVVPNHALIILGLLYGGGDFHRSLTITNTCGWDTDCNSGNLGCLLGIMNGLAGFQGDFDLRTPVGDRLFVISADGGRAISDALIEAYYLANAALEAHCRPLACPKGDARFHFSLPGAVQGFQAEVNEGKIDQAWVQNVPGRKPGDERCLKMLWNGVEGGCVSTFSPTFIQPDELDMPGYALVASPTLYSGQLVKARVISDEANPVPLPIRLFCALPDAKDIIIRFYGPRVYAKPGDPLVLSWQVPDTSGQPIIKVGLEVVAENLREGAIYLDYLTWRGAPDVFLTRPEGGGNYWQRAWVDSLDQAMLDRVPFHLVQNRGRGMLTQGTSEWCDYVIRARITPTLLSSGGIAGRVQGLSRFYALLISTDNRIMMVKSLETGNQVIAEFDFHWEPWQEVELEMQFSGDQIQAYCNREKIITLQDTDHPLQCGAAGFIVEDGHIMTPGLRVLPLVKTSRIDTINRG